MVAERNRWRERDIDNDLMLELLSDGPSEARIRELVARGADFNSLWIGDSVLMNVLFLVGDRPDDWPIRLIIDLGADVNFQSDDGGCVLSDACFFSTAEVVEYLLQHGANPNAVYDFSDSILGTLEEDKRFHETEFAGIPEYMDFVRRLEQNIAVLKRHGAKKLDEHRTDRVSRWLHIFGCGGTGLLTSTGYIEADAIPELTNTFREDFKAWKASFWDSWPDKDWSTMPPNFDRARHNQWGRCLARDIRVAVPPDIRVEYLSISAADEEKKIRSVDWERLFSV